MNDHTSVVPARSRLHSQQPPLVSVTDSRLVVTLDGKTLVTATLTPLAHDHAVRAVLEGFDGDSTEQAVLAACEGLFAHHPHLHYIDLAGLHGPALDRFAARSLLRPQPSAGYRCYAEAFWQTPEPWALKHSYVPAAQQWVTSGERRHPLRSIPTSGVLYQRFVPWVNQTLTLEVVDIERDLQRFNRWMNTPRVAHFWEEQGNLDQHRTYLQKQLDSRHSVPVIGRFDGEAFGYFELYWAKEDRIAPFYDADDYDRGLHLLVGEEAYRGKLFYTAWFSSICHYLFLDDPRTQRVVCEPRHDNHRQIANFDRSGFAKLKHFDFPHKRALLVMLSRERFFTDRLYQPLGASHLQESTS